MNLPRTGILIALFIVSAVGLWSLPPIAQDSVYHQFADQRNWLGIPHFGDVLSNLPFVLIGVYGLWMLSRYQMDPDRFRSRVEILPFVTAFIGIICVGFGSAYYHIYPSNGPLVWDRLPITIALTSVFTCVLAERVGLKAAIFLLPVFLFLGISSIWYWDFTESFGRGDLRPYVLVQLYPMLAIPAMLILFPPRYTRTGYLVAMILWNGISKVFEYFDKEIFDLSGEWVSGHTLKHLAAGAACYALVQYIKNRRCREDG
jgi:hypothetical protein